MGILLSPVPPLPQRDPLNTQKGTAKPTLIIKIRDNSGKLVNSVYLPQSIKPNVFFHLSLSALGFPAPLLQQHCLNTWDNHECGINTCGITTHGTVNCQSLERADTQGNPVTYTYIEHPIIFCTYRLNLKQDFLPPTAGK